MCIILWTEKKKWCWQFLSFCPTGRVMVCLCKIHRRNKHWKDRNEWVLRIFDFVSLPAGEVCFSLSPSKEHYVPYSVKFCSCACSISSHRYSHSTLGYPECLFLIQAKIRFCALFCLCWMDDSNKKRRRFLGDCFSESAVVLYSI